MNPVQSIEIKSKKKIQLKSKIKYCTPHSNEQNENNTNLLKSSKYPPIVEYYLLESRNSALAMEIRDYVHGTRAFYIIL